MSSLNYQERNNPQVSQICQTIQNVKKILSRMLEELGSIYESVGVNFKINHLHDVIVRIVTPFQLLSHFQVVDNSNLLYQEKNKSNNISPFQFNANIDNIEPFTLYETNLEDLKLIPGGFQQISYQKQKLRKHKKHNNTQNRRKEKKYYCKSNRGILLTQQAEAELTDWIYNKITRNIYLRRKDIRKKAKKISNHPNFLASKHWLTQYLKRHPQLATELNRIARANKGKRKRQKYVNSDDSNSQQMNQIEKFMSQNYEQNLIAENEKSDWQELSEDLDSQLMSINEEQFNKNNTSPKYLQTDEIINTNQKPRQMTIKSAQNQENRFLQKNIIMKNIILKSNLTNQQILMKKDNKKQKQKNKAKLHDLFQNINDNQQINQDNMLQNYPTFN